MSSGELDSYQKLWKEKTAIARTQAAAELKGMAAETKADIVNIP
jgi:hypothetical protein